MMRHIDVQLPENVFAVLQCAPNEFEEELRLAAAMQWYQQGRISQEWAATIAGMDRTDFLLTLARYGRDSFQVDFDELEEELNRD